MTAKAVILYCRQLEYRNMPSGAVELISTVAPAMASNSAGGDALFAAASNRPLIGQRNLSDDGRYLVFASAAANLVAGQIDANNDSDIFLYDRVLDETLLISHSSNSALATGDEPSSDPVINSDGRYIAFTGRSTNLISGITSNTFGLFLYDRITDAMTLVNHAFNDPLSGSGAPSDVRISADGNWIAYKATGGNLLIENYIPDSLANTAQLYLYERATGTNRLVSHIEGMNNKGAELRNSTPLLSDNGRYVAFESSSSSIVTGANPLNYSQVYIYDRMSDSNVLVSHAKGQPNVGANGAQTFVNGISADGGYVLLLSLANNLINGMVDNNSPNQPSVFLYDRQNASASLIDHVPGSPVVTGNQGAFQPRLSKDGTTVVFQSAATNLVAGMIDESPESDLFVFSRITGVISLISHRYDSTTTSGNAVSMFADVSDDGNSVTFESRANNLTAGFTDGNSQDQFATDLFSYDRLSRTATLVSHISGATVSSGNDKSYSGQMSADGQWVAFASRATNIIDNDKNNHVDLFVWNSQANANGIVGKSRADSLSAGGESGNGNGATWQQVSNDGRFVVFVTNAENVVPGQIDNNRTNDVFVRDRINNAVVLVSHVPHLFTATGNSDSSTAVISGDGRFVAYSSRSTNLIDGFIDGNGSLPGNYICTDVYLWDRLTGTNILVSHRFDSALIGGNGVSGSSTINNNWEISSSLDGRFVVYRSQATDLVAGFVDGNGQDSQGLLGSDFYLYDRLTSKNVLITHTAENMAWGSNGNVRHLTISSDGRYVAFSAQGTNLIEGYIGSFGTYNIYIDDRLLGVRTLVSHAAAAVTMSANGSSGPVFLSADSSHLVFASAANNLVLGTSDTNAGDDVFLYQLETASTILVSHVDGNINQAGDFPSNRPSLNADGTIVTYASRARNLIGNFVDQNGTGNSGYDVFVFDKTHGTTTLVSRSTSQDWAGANSDASFPQLTNDGRFVFWTSNATNVLNGTIKIYSNSTRQIFRFDRILNQTILVSHGPLGTFEYGNGGVSLTRVESNGSIVAFSSNADILTSGDFNGHFDFFAYVTPPPRVTSVQINDGSPQRSIIRSLTITFDDYVFLDSNPLSIVSGQGGVVGGVQWAAEYQNNSTIVTVTFTGANTEFGSLADGNYELRVIGDRISAVGFLDGNGDGIGGDDFTFTFHRLFGDANGDRTVNSMDFAELMIAYRGSGMTFDFNNDGVVTAADFMQFRLRYGVTI